MFVQNATNLYLPTPPRTPSPSPPSYLASGTFWRISCETIGFQFLRRCAYVAETREIRALLQRSLRLSTAEAGWKNGDVWPWWRWSSLGQPSVIMAFFVISVVLIFYAVGQMTRFGFPTSLFKSKTIYGDVSAGDFFQGGSWEHVQKLVKLGAYTAYALLSTGSWIFFILMSFTTFFLDKNPLSRKQSRHFRERKKLVRSWAVGRQNIFELFFTCSLKFGHTTHELHFDKRKIKVWASVTVWSWIM